MVDLMALYERHGYQLAARELPDYLPLFLEYLSMRPLEEIRDALGNVAHILAVLTERLTRRETSYASLFETLLVIAAEEVDRNAIREQLRDEKPDDTPAALDKVWEEEAVTFGGNAISGGCPSNQYNGAASAGRTLGNINVRAV
jgi:nitrate reductase delta subunit